MGPRDTEREKAHISLSKIFGKTIVPPPEGLGPSTDGVHQLSHNRWTTISGLRGEDQW